MMELGERAVLATDVLPRRTRAPAPVPGARDRSAEVGSALGGHDSFIALVGHELRNALGPMQLLAEQFAALAASPSTRPLIALHAAALTDHLRRFVATIDGVAEIADLRRDRLDLARVSVDLAEIARQVCGELAGQAAAAGAELVLDAGVPVTGSWDRVRLGRILTNLVCNAIRHAGGRIEIIVSGRDREAEVVVRDHGPGLDPAVARCLDAEPGAGRRTGGIGFGLWLVKTLSEAMQGHVKVTNCSDGGARFCVVVPRG